MVMDRVLIRPINKEEEQMKKIGMVLPTDKVKRGSAAGIVLATGPKDAFRCTKCDQHTVDVKEGDKVMFKLYDNLEIETDEGEKLAVVNSRDLLAIIED